MTGSHEPLTVAPIAPEDAASIAALWERCGLTRPWNDPRADIALALRGPNSTILAGRRDGAIVASVLVGHDGHRGWVYYVAVDPAYARRGYGRGIMAAAEDWLKLRGIQKTELMIRTENHVVQAFYTALGYTVDARIVMSRWLDGRDPTP